MAVYKGQVFGLYIKDASGNYIKIGGVRNKEISQSKELLSKASDDNADYESYVGAIKSGETTFESLYDYNDTGYDLLSTAYDSDDPSDFSLREGNEANDKKTDFSAHVNDFARTYNTNELSVLSATLTIDGEVTEGTVSA
jgi:hypothetical protein